MEQTALSARLLRRYRGVFLGDDVDEECSDLIRQELTRLCAHKTTPINVFIDSNGGSTSDGLHIYDVIRSMPVPTIGRVIGRCHSIAVSILQGCTERVALPNSDFFLHSTVMNLSDLSTGPANLNESYEKITAEMKGILDQQKRLDAILCSRSKVTAKKLQHLYYQGDRLERNLTADEALALGLVDRLSIELFPNTIPPRQ